jgi:hypothetical protein
MKILLSLLMTTLVVTMNGQTITSEVLLMDKNTGIIKFQVKEGTQIKEVANLLMEENYDINKFESELGYLITSEKKVTKKLGIYYTLRLTLIGNELSIKGFMTKPLYDSSEMSNVNLVKPIGMKGSPQKVVSDEMVDLANRLLEVLK